MQVAKKWPEIVVKWPNVKFVYFSSSQTLPPGVDPTAGVLFPRSPDAWALRDISNAT